ncbi:MAG: Gfo/Idh/MocA family oxidoreductase [bacterium]
MLKVCVVGMGYMGVQHLRAWERIKFADVTALVDADAAKSAEAEKFGLRFYTDIENALNSEKPDVVDICLPTHLHRSAVETALAAGCHVMCEKPIAARWEDALAVRDAAQKSGRKFMVGHVIRFFHEYSAAHALVQSGKIGDVGVVRTFRRAGFPSSDRGWYSDEEKSGGMIVDMMIHDFYFLLWLFGDAERIYAKRVAAHGVDCALVTMRFASGAVAHLEGNWTPGAPFTYGFELAGTKGLIAFDSTRRKPLWIRQYDAGVESGESPIHNSPYYLQTEHFAQCIINDSEPVVTVDDALQTLRLALAACESTRTGKVIELTGFAG